MMPFQQCIDNYKQNQDITRMLNTLDIYILPVMNPDGYKYTWTTVGNAGMCV